MKNPNVSLSPQSKSLRSTTTIICEIAFENFSENEKIQNINKNENKNGAEKELTNATVEKGFR